MGKKIECATNADKINLDALRAIWYKEAAAEIGRAYQIHDPKYYQWKWGSKPKVAKATQAWTKVREGPRIEAQGLKCKLFGADLKEIRSLLKNKQGIGPKANRILDRWTQKSADALGFDASSHEWKNLHIKLVVCKCEGMKPWQQQNDVHQAINDMIVTVVKRTEIFENEAKKVRKERFFEYLRDAAKGHGRALYKFIKQAPYADDVGEGIPETEGEKLKNKERFTATYGRQALNVVI